MKGKGKRRGGWRNEGEGEEEKGGGGEGKREEEKGPDINTHLLSLQTHLVVHIPMDRHLGLGLPLEEGVMELLVVNGQLPHLGPHPFPRLLLQGLCVLLVLQCLSHLHNPSGLWEMSQVRAVQ